MKKGLFFLSVLFVMVATPAFASFPINVEETKSEATVNSVSEDALEATDVIAADQFETVKNAFAEKATSSMDEEMIILLVLWLLLWPLAAHRWYADKSAGSNILFILTFGGFGIWAIIDLINILTGDFY